ncbi:uncharacterized protein SETTUDRAFT_60404, partial [Exserohilum turcica Et28A]
MAPGERSEEVWLWYTAGHQLRAHCAAGGKAQVGVCLKHLPSPWAGSNNNNSNNKNREARFHSGNVPWQRVINAKGAISPRGPGAAGRQAEALRREGVVVELRQHGLGVYSVDLGEYGWFPDMLPSEAGGIDESD